MKGPLLAPIWYTSIEECTFARRLSNGRYAVRITAVEDDIGDMNNVDIDTTSKSGDVFFTLQLMDELPFLEQLQKDYLSPYRKILLALSNGDEVDDEHDAMLVCQPQVSQVVLVEHEMYLRRELIRCCVESFSSNAYNNSKRVNEEGGSNEDSCVHVTNEGSTAECPVVLRCVDTGRRFFHEKLNKKIIDKGGGAAKKNTSKFSGTNNHRRGMEEVEAKLPLLYAADAVLFRHCPALGIRTSFGRWYNAKKRPLVIRFLRDLVENQHAVPIEAEFFAAERSLFGFEEDLDGGLDHFNGFDSAFSVRLKISNGIWGFAGYTIRTLPEDLDRLVRCA